MTSEYYKLKNRGKSKKTNTLNNNSSYRTIQYSSLASMDRIQSKSKSNVVFLIHSTQHDVTLHMYIVYP